VALRLAHLTGEHLPLLLQAAGAISADWAACQAVPHLDVPRTQPTVADRGGQLEQASGIRTEGLVNERA
jgi:hypothetical protein